MKAIERLPYLLVLALIALLAGCGQEERSGEGAPATQREEAPAEAAATADQTQSAPLPASGSGLRVLQFLPDGQTSKLTQIVAMFNQPMVALGDYDSADQSLMVLDPPLPGRLRWLNQYCLAFVPDEPLFGSLSLSVTLGAGLASLSGDVLADERRISLSLPPVEVVSSYRNTYVPDPTPLRPSLTVFFNQSPDLASLKAKGFFEGQDGAGRPFRVPIEAETDEDGGRPSGFREVRIRPAGDLPRDTPYSLVVEPGLVSLAGPEPTALPITVFSDRTYGPLEASLYGPEDENGLLVMKSPDDYLSIEFNNPVALSEALAKIESDPPFPALDELKRRVLGPKPGGEAGQAPSPGSPQDDGPQASGQPEEAPEEATEQDDMGWDHADGLRTSISFYPANLKSRSAYSFTVKAGLKDVYGQVLEEDQVVSFRTGSYRPSVAIDSRTAILETGTRPIIPVEAVNTPSFRVLGYALSQDQARELIVLSKADLGHGYAHDYKAGLDFLSRNASPVSQEFRPPDGAVDGPVRMGLDLEGLFGQDRLGHFLVLTVPDEKNQSFSMFQISDLGLTVKIGRTTGLAWTTDLASGRGLGGVSLEIVTPSGQSLWQGQSGPDGLAWLPGGQELARIASGQDDGDWPSSGYLSLFVVAKDQRQMTLWNLAWNEGFEPYVMNLDRYPQSPFGPNPDLGFVMASQPVYRPGEKVGLKLIAREVNGEEVADLPPGPAKAVIANDDRLVAEIPVEIGPLGTGSLEFQLPDNARLGTYYVLLAKDPSTDVEGAPYVFSIPGLVHYGNFQVENFRAPAFGIAYEDLPRETVSGQRVEVAAQALYHFGGPVANRPAEYSFSSQDVLDFSLPTLPGYSLVNAMSVLDDEGTEDDDYGPVVGILLSGQGTLDSQGRLLFALDLEPAARPRPRQLTVHLGAQDVDSRSVYKTADILAHPASVYPALKTREFLGQAGQPLALDFAAASLDGTLVKSQVDITLFQRSWNTVRRRTSGGFYDYSSRASDKVVREISVTSSPDGPSSVELVPPRAGFYWVKASLKDDQGRANESSVSFYVHGDGPVGWLPSRDEGLTLIPDREAYAPGDTARILVQSPFSEAQALVTVERSGVREASLVDVQGQTPILEIPIGPDDGPNLFVSVILSRGRIAEEPDDDNVDLGKPATRKGYLSLRIPSRADILSVDVQTDAEIYAPGDQVRVNIRVAGQDGAEAGESEIALAVVDATLVQLLGDEGYFPDRIFSSDRPLSVLTVNPIAILMGRRNLALKGGVDAGGGAMALAESMAKSDDPRSDFRNLAFFEPSVPVSPDGTAQVSFSLPDNLTTFKIYAVATGHGRLSGTGQKDFLVTKDVLLRPSLPAYSSLGDDFVAAATVTNRSDRPGQAKVSLSADNVEIVDAFSEKEVSLAPGQSLEVGFQVKASVLGTAGFTFAVDMDGQTDSARYEIPVVPVNALVTQASYRQLSPGLTPVDLALPEGLDQQRGGLSLELSPSLVGLLAGPLAFLRDYPHACMEQLTSKALGHLISIRLRDRLGLSPEEVAQAEARVREHMALVASSNKEGGYDPWPGTFGWEGRSPIVSAYVLEFLLEARDADFDVPPVLIGDAVGYLSSVIGDPKANSRDWYGPEAIDSMTAYAAMVLARSGEPVSSFLEVLFLKRETLPLADLVNLIRGLGYLPPSASRSQMLRDAISLLQNSLSLAPGQAHFSEVPKSPWIWADDDKLTAMALLALCQTAPHNEFIPQLVRDLVSRASRGSFSSTQSNVHALLALSSYLALAEPEDPDLSISATLGDKELLSAVFSSPLTPPARATEPISALSGAKTLDISSEGTGEAWATVRLSFAPLAPDLSADNPSSLSISRSYSVLRPEASSPGLSSFKRGQVVQVTVTLMTPEDRHDLVLEDRIPAGFETINLRFLSEDQTLVPGTDPESTGWKYTDSFWFDHQEIWPDRVSVYADFLPAGVYTFSYLVRPVTLGTYQVPGPRAEEMYSPEVYGRGPGQTLSVVPANSN